MTTKRKVMVIQMVKIIATPIVSVRSMENVTKTTDNLQKKGEEK